MPPSDGLLDDSVPTILRRFATHEHPKGWWWLKEETYDGHCLVPRGAKWSVYLQERGERYDEQTFSSRDEALDFVIDRFYVSQLELRASKVIAQDSGSRMEESNKCEEGRCGQAPGSRPVSMISRGSCLNLRSTPASAVRVACALDLWWKNCEAGNYRAMQPVTVFYLEMNCLSDLKEKTSRGLTLRVIEVGRKNWRVNRFFYTWVGAEWSWTDRLSWSDGRWRDHAEREHLGTYIGYLDDRPIGYFELETKGSEIDIAIFGIEPRSIGLGLGGQLLTEAVRIAWAFGPRRVTVNTCTLDHPGALANYLARGFSLVRLVQKNEPRVGA